MNAGSFFGVCSPARGLCFFGCFFELNPELVTWCVRAQSRKPYLYAQEIALLDTKDLPMTYLEGSHVIIAQATTKGANVKLNKSEVVARSHMSVRAPLCTPTPSRMCTYELNNHYPRTN